MVQFALLYAFLKTRKETKKREREDGRGWVARGIRRETIGGIIEKRQEAGKEKWKGAGKERSGRGQRKREEGGSGEREKRE